MDYVRFSTLGKIVLLVQITALLLLQTYPLAPSSATLRPSRAGEAGRTWHHRCGCPVERVSSRTCCCFLTHGRCASGKKNAPQRSPTGKDNSTIYICDVPCGWPAKINTYSSASHEFLGTSFTFTQAAVSVLATPAAQKTLKEIFSQPPVPPPEIAALLCIA